MKLVKFKHNSDYIFTLTFKNKQSKDVDLYDLIGQYVPKKNLETAQINSDWGCLEFNGGTVDIEPQTLYNYSFGVKQAEREVA